MATKKITDVDPEQITLTCGELDSCVSQMNSAIKNITIGMEELKKTWSGEASQAFIAQFEGDKATFGIHISEYQKLNDALRQTGKSYHSSDQEILSNLAKLKI